MHFSFTDSNDVATGVGKAGDVLNLTLPPLQWVLAFATIRSFEDFMRR